MSYKELLKQSIATDRFPITDQIIEERSTAKLLHDAQMDEAVEQFNTAFNLIEGKLKSHVDNYKSSEDVFEQIIYDFSQAFLDLREYFEDLINSQSKTPREAMELTQKKGMLTLLELFKKHLSDV